TADSGQLDIAAVAELPPNNSYAGYRMYRFDDALQAEFPVFIKLEFGVANEGLSPSGSTNARRGNSPRIRATVATETDGSGQVGGQAIRTFACPQEWAHSNGAYPTPVTNNGLSYCCRNDDVGFFGFIYGAGSRNNPPPSGSDYVGATLAF